MFFHPGLGSSLDVPRLSDPSYRTSGEGAVTSVAVHLLQSTVVDAADVLDGVPELLRGSPLHFSSMHIGGLYGWLAWMGLTCEICTADLTWIRTCTSASPATVSFVLGSTAFFLHFLVSTVEDHSSAVELLRDSAGLALLPPLGPNYIYNPAFPLFFFL